MAYTSRRPLFVPTSTQIPLCRRKCSRYRLSVCARCRHRDAPLERSQSCERTSAQAAQQGKLATCHPTRLPLAHRVHQLRKDRSSKPVETRKFIKLYLEFLKDSQRYYRDYIQKLNARFGGIQDLERIARQVRSDRTSSPTTITRYIHRG